MTIDPTSYPAAEEPSATEFTDYFDLVDEVVDATTDDEVDAALAAVLGTAGYRPAPPRQEAPEGHRLDFGMLDLNTSAGIIGEEHRRQELLAERARIEAELLAVRARLDHELQRLQSATTSADRAEQMTVEARQRAKDAAEGAEKYVNTALDRAQEIVGQARDEAEQIREAARQEAQEILHTRVHRQVADTARMLDHLATKGAALEEEYRVLKHHAALLTQGFDSEILGSCGRHGRRESAPFMPDHLSASRGPAVLRPPWWRDDPIVVPGDNDLATVILPYLGQPAAREPEPPSRWRRAMGRVYRWWGRRRRDAAEHLRPDPAMAPRLPLDDALFRSHLRRLLLSTDAHVSVRPWEGLSDPEDLSLEILDTHPWDLACRIDGRVGGGVHQPGDETPERADGDEAVHACVQE